MIRAFLAPTPRHIRKWQLIFSFIGGLATVLELTEKTIPTWLNVTVALCGYIGTFLMQFVTEKSE
jgi:hypothetical protein